MDAGSTSDNSDTKLSISLTDSELTAFEAASKGASPEEFLKSIALSAAKKFATNSSAKSQGTTSGTEFDPSTPITVVGIGFSTESRTTTLGELRSETAKLNIQFGIRDEILMSPDRSAGIVGAAYVESGLEELLRACWGHLNSEVIKAALSPFSGIVGTFAAKSLVSYLAGIIGPETKTDLDLIREIRNTCAHWMTMDRDMGFIPVSFDSAALSGLCDALKFANGHSLSYGDGQSLEATSPRNRFVLTSIMIGDQLRGCATRITRFGMDKSALEDYFH